MSGKASVSKDLNAKHAKILEDLLKLPENKECADCRCKAPRWASINLGIFICMQCSGTHRSLGVHISKVRSTTLDTWLPEQVALMQSTGNKVANNYWEAELPPNYNRRDIEKFIRNKYQDSKWVSRTSSQPIPSSSDKSKSHAKGGIPKKARTDPPKKNVDATTDFYSILNDSKANQDCTIESPSLWATFDCKWFLLNLVLLDFGEHLSHQAR